MAAAAGMGLIGRVLIGALILAVCAVAWYLLTQRNRGGSGCSGNCAGCSAQCENRKGS